MNSSALLTALATRGYRSLTPRGADALGFTLYSAQQGDRPVQIAVASLRAGGWDMETRFLQTASRWRQLHHEGLPLYLEDFAVDTADDRLLVRVTEAVPGQPLAPGLGEAALRELAVGLLETLAYLHGEKQVHGGLRPEIVRRGGGRVALTEIGGWDSPTVTALATAAGFLAPEQYRGEATAASDLYSLGATLIFLHTGRLLSELPQNGGLLDGDQALPQLSQEMRWWLMELVEPLPENRPLGAEAARTALIDRTLALVAPPPSPRWTVRKTSRAFEATCRQNLLDLVLHYPLTVLAFAILALQAIARLGPGLSSWLPFANLVTLAYLGLWIGTLVLLGANVNDAIGDAQRKLGLSLGLVLTLGAAWFGLWATAVVQQWPGCQPSTPLGLVTCAFWTQNVLWLYVGVTLWLCLAVAGQAPPRQVRYRFDDRQYEMQHRRGGWLGWLGWRRRVAGENRDIQDLTLVPSSDLILRTQRHWQIPMAPLPLWARDRQWLAQELRHFLYFDRKDLPPL